MTGHKSDSRVLAVEHLSKHFPVKAGWSSRASLKIRAVDDVSLHVNVGETLAVVGESGSGKSTLGRSIVRAVDPTRGSIKLKLVDGNWVDITTLRERHLRPLRRNFHMIFQDPFSSLDPRMTVFDIVSEPLVHNEALPREELRKRVVEVLSLVGLSERHLSHYPHAFSGGQRQRIGVARSLVCRPRLIVCDEAVSALDVSVQAQILNLLKDLQRRFDIAFLFISHDIAVVEFIAQRTSVMYVGRIVEMGPTSEIIGRPLHPYTEALLDSVPVADPHRERSRSVIGGEIASPINPPSGCHFHPRCQYSSDLCKSTSPAFREIRPGRFAACHHAESLTLRGMHEARTRPPHAARLWTHGEGLR